MSKLKSLEKKVEELEKEIKWLQQKFHRSGVDPKVRMKTLLRMQQLTHDFLVWFARWSVERAKEKEKEAEEK